MTHATQDKFCDPTSTSSTDHDHVGIDSVSDLSDHRSWPAIFHNRPVPDTRGSQALAPLSLKFILHAGSPHLVELRWHDRGHKTAIKVHRRSDREYGYDLGVHPFRHSSRPLDRSLCVLGAVDADHDSTDTSAIHRHIPDS